MREKKHLTEGKRERAGDVYVKEEENKWVIADEKESKCVIYIEN